MRDTYGATDPRSQQLRIFAFTAGSTFTAQQPLNNVARASIEATAAALAVLADLLIPSLLLLAMAVVSLAVRRAGLGSLGLRRLTHGWRVAGLVLVLTVLWSVFQLSVTMPIANHVSGHRQDLDAFDDLQGNVGLLLVLLVVGWVLGAVVEEVAYRGYLLTRIREAIGHGRVGVWLAVLASSLLFGLAHTEQGAVGVAVVTLDGLFFCALRYRFRSLWASVLAHGCNNTLGFLAFFLVGPIYGFW
jgi:membrane protease YdiL (CAAX protease family)